MCVLAVTVVDRESDIYWISSGDDSWRPGRLPLDLSLTPHPSEE